MSMFIDIYIYMYIYVFIYIYISIHFYSFSLTYAFLLECSVVAKGRSEVTSIMRCQPPWGFVPTMPPRGPRGHSVVRQAMDQKLIVVPWFMQKKNWLVVWNIFYFPIYWE